VITGSRFEIVPGLRISITGGAADVRHFDREYAPCRVAGPESSGATDQDSSPAVDVAVGMLRSGTGTTADERAMGLLITGGHKTVRWAVRLSAAGDRPTSATIELRGAPASFARSLVQGYYVEPLLSVAAAEVGYLQLPSAGIVGDAGLDILIGRSQAGKSTLAARALAAGRRVIGDDQVVVDAAGQWRPFPRRLRFYPDLRVTAPGAWADLTSGSRSRLVGRRAMAALSLGLVRPSLAVDPAELGRRWDPGPIPAARILLLGRDPSVRDVEIVMTDTHRALDWAEEVITEQRSKLTRVGDEAWSDRLRATSSREREILTAAIEGVAVHEVRIPDNWPAARAIEATARAIGLS